MHLRKRFGQHWLKSEAILTQIIEAAELEKSDRILEIGPGTGILTHRLLPHVAAVVAVEIDRDLVKKLVSKFGKVDNCLLLEGDFLSLDLAPLLQSFPQFQNLNKVVANIPYNITSPILEKLLGSLINPNPDRYESIVLLVQKEVAARIIAQPGTKAYGAMSIRIQYLATCDWICTVPRKAFSPPPQVESAVIRLRPRLPIGENEPLNPKHLDTILRLGFANRRKMLRNNLTSLIEQDLFTQILAELSLNPQVRGEELSLQQWIDLSNGISEYQRSEKKEE